MTRPPWPTGFSGVVLAQRSGTTVFERVQGLADHGRREPCTRGTRFQIASVSKQFTAAAVLLLAGRGLISLQDRIERWLGTCPAPWRPITVHHLLTHTAGLGHWQAYPDVDHHRPVPPERLLDLFTRVPLLSAPGAAFSYSGPGYVLLAWIVEQVSGQPYGRFLAKCIGTAAGQRAYFHSGGNPGYRAVNAWLPDDDVRIALCGNDEAADIGQILTQALREALAF